MLIGGTSVSTSRPEHRRRATGGGQIWRANLDGTDLEVIVVGLNRPRDVALDLSVGRVYWTDEANKAIQSANLDGSAVATIVSGLTGPSSLTLVARRKSGSSKSDSGRSRSKSSKSDSRRR